MLFARNFHFKERNASGKCVLCYLVPKHIACNDVIGSNWHYRDTNHTNYRDMGYFGQKLMGYGILRPPLMGPHHSLKLSLIFLRGRGGCTELSTCRLFSNVVCFFFTQLLFIYLFKV